MVGNHQAQCLWWGLRLSLVLLLYNFPYRWNPLTAGGIAKHLTFSHIALRPVTAHANFLTMPHKHKRQDRDAST